MSALVEAAIEGGARFICPHHRKVCMTQGKSGRWAHKHTEGGQQFWCLAKLATEVRR